MSAQLIEGAGHVEQLAAAAEGDVSVLSRAGRIDGDEGYALVLFALSEVELQQRAGVARRHGGRGDLLRAVDVSERDVLRGLGNACGAIANRSPTVSSRSPPPMRDPPTNTCPASRWIFPARTSSRARSAAAVALRRRPCWGPPQGPSSPPRRTAPSRSPTAALRPVRPACRRGTGSRQSRRPAGRRTSGTTWMPAAPESCSIAANRLALSWLPGITRTALPSRAGRRARR